MEYEAKLMIDALYRDPDRLADRVEAFWTAEDQQEEKRAAERQDLLDRLNGLLGRRDRVVGAFGRESITEEDMRRELDKIEGERDAIHEQLKQLEPEPVALDTAATREHLRRLVESIRKDGPPHGGLDSADVELSLPMGHEDYRQALLDLVQRVWVEPDGRLTWDIVGEPSAKALDFTSSR